MYNAINDAYTELRLWRQYTVGKKHHYLSTNH